MFSTIYGACPVPLSPGSLSLGFNGFLYVGWYGVSNKGVCLILLG